MPGNRSTYNNAIKKGHNAAWDGQWTKAVTEYRRALVEFPDDLSVRSSLAQALEALGQHEDALTEYRNLALAQPRDPLLLTRVAVLQEKLRRPAEAAGTYLAAADLYLAGKAVPKAVEAWLNASRLEPDRTDVHQRLAEYYAHSAQHAQASQEYVALARIYRKRGDQVKTLNLARHALAVDAHNNDARALVKELDQSELASQVSVPSPVGQAEKTALSRLAETLLEDPTGSPKEGAAELRQTSDRPRINQIEVDALIARAVDAQMHHRIPEAIDSYRKLMAAGITRPEVQFNLGLLYFETMRYDDAIQMLTATVDDTSYALASHYALGQCYRALGKMDNAVEHFLQVVKIVDLGSVNREQADDLISVYEGLAESYAAKGDRTQAESFSQSLEEFLTSKGWEDKVQQVRHHLETLQADGNQVSLAEAIQVPESDKVLEALALAQEYLRRDKLGAASEECYRAIELAPNYLPAHIRLAEIMMRQDRLTDANAKYQILSELCIIRGDLPRAESLYRSALKITPDDVGTRSKLVDLLAQQNRTEDALAEYLALGDVYARAGQPVKAIEKFTEGVRVAARTGITNVYATNLRHRLAEIRARQGDFKNALALYQEIHHVSPDDERAHFYIVDLEFRLGRPNAALSDLEDLLVNYQQHGEPKKATGVLEALAQNYPTESGLAMRLAQNYHATGMRDKAIATLDVLGEAQLSAGQRQAAAETIRHIVEMNPPRVEDYKKLLKEISE